MACAFRRAASERLLGAGLLACHGAPHSTDDGPTNKGEAPGHEKRPRSEADPILQRTAAKLLRSLCPRRHQERRGRRGGPGLQLRRENERCLRVPDRHVGCRHVGVPNWRLVTALAASTSSSQPGRSRMTRTSRTRSFRAIQHDRAARGTHFVSPARSPSGRGTHPSRLRRRRRDRRPSRRRPRRSNRSALIFGHSRIIIRL